MNLRPKDQIVLLAGLESTATREWIWKLPELQATVERLTDAGLISEDSLVAPDGVVAARGIRHITLRDLVAEHLPEHLPERA